MTRPVALQADERQTALSDLDGWREAPGRNALSKTFTFKNFNQAFGFMTRSALLAERMDHHPEWFNVYKTIEVTLTTHDADGVTELDLRMARAMNRYAIDS